VQFASGRWLAAMRYRDFRLLWTGEFISAAGTEMFFVSLNWQMYLLTHSALALGLIGLARSLPIILFSLLGGAFADAHNRKKILYVTQSVMILCSLLLAFATFTQLVTPLLMYLLTGLDAAAVAFDMPARSALVPNLVDRKDLANALSIYEILWQIASITGPAIAGFLIASIGVGGVYSIDAVSTIAVLLALLLIHNPGEPGGEKTAVSFASMKEGLAFVRSKTILWSTMLLDFLGTFLASAITLLPIYAKDILHAGPQGLGLLYAAPTAGALLAGFFMAQYGQSIKRQGKVLLLAIAAYALATILFGVSRNYLLSLFALALVGGSDCISMVIRQTIRQLATPDWIRGRMSSIMMIFFMGGPQLGEFEAGLVAAAVGAPLSVVLGGAATLGMLGIMAFSIPTLRNYRNVWEEPLPSR
jgi:MFS family permease